MTTEQHPLVSVLKQYGKPDPSIVSKLPKRFKKPDGSFGSIELDYVGHADVTRMLIEIDPMWTWEPVAWEDGRPAITVTNGMATMWGRLTVLGKTMLGVGSCDAGKQDMDKELVGDFLRNAAMRFGICLSLWTKAEWESAPAAPVEKATPEQIVEIQSLIASLGNGDRDKLKRLWKNSHLPPVAELTADQVEKAKALHAMLAKFHEPARV